MTPEQLKASILQYAIQGKLVEQRPEEGTAEELYQQIQKEKQKLIKEGKIKKEKPLAEITDEEVPFDIPESWKWVRLNEIVFNHGQKSPNNTFAYIDIGSIDNRHQRLNENENIVEAKCAPSRARKIIEHGDILYATVRPYLHNMCIIDRKFQREPIASTGFAVMACYIGVFNKYLFFYLLSPEFDKYANATENSKGVAYPAINDEKLYRAVVPLPPLKEQNRIVAKIEELLPYVDRYAKAYEKLERFNAKFPEDMKKSILQYAIQGKLVEQRPEEGTAEELYQQIQKEKQKLIREGAAYREKNICDINKENDLPDIPESWKWCRLGELTKLITKGSSPKWQGVNYTNAKQGILFITSENVGNECMLMKNEKYVDERFNDMHPSSILQKGDILTNIVGASIGRTAIYNLSVDNANINQAVCLIRLVDSKLKDYVLKYLQSPYAVKHLLGDASNGGRPNLSLTSVANLIIALPPLEEQYRIVAKIEELLPYCDKLLK
ncbi:MAG: restriction endonuclease subunit S [Lachnospiraceae bacterium]|nr:restriction endonuclease subunit S [Lachnospiraceae bacterium]